MVTNCEPYDIETWRAHSVLRGCDTSDSGLLSAGADINFLRRPHYNFRPCTEMFSVLPNSGQSVKRGVIHSFSLSRELISFIIEGMHTINKRPLSPPGEGEGP